MPSVPGSLAPGMEEELDWEDRSWSWEDFGKAKDGKDGKGCDEEKPPMPSDPPSLAPGMEEELDWEDRSWSWGDFGKAKDGKDGKGCDEEKPPVRDSHAAPRPPTMDDSDWETRSWSDLDTGCKRPAPNSSQATTGWDDEDDAGDGPGQRWQPAAGTTVIACTVTPCHDRRFVRFAITAPKVFAVKAPRVDMVFEVTAKYGTPIEYIGGGAYGTVCSVFDLDEGKKVAIKKIPNAFEDAVQAKMALREVMLLRHISHCNIVAVLDIIPPLCRDSFSDVYIVSDLIHTDMDKVIYSDEPLSDERCQSYLHQLLCGLKYLHSADIIHRDLKPSNLLLTKDHVLKICDFGQSRGIPWRGLNMTSRVGTLYYKAPEILLLASVYNAAIDMWSVGCILMELMLRKPAFQGINEEHQLSLILELIGTPAEGADLSFLDRTATSNVLNHAQHPRRSFAEKFPDTVNPLAIDLLEKILVFDPKQRIRVEEALAHPYLGGFPDAHPVCPVPFPKSSSLYFEMKKLSVEEMKDLIYQAALQYNPQFRV